MMWVGREPAALPPAIDFQVFGLKRPGALHKARYPRDVALSALGDRQGRRPLRRCATTMCGHDGAARRRPLRRAFDAPFAFHAPFAARSFEPVGVVDWRA